MKTAQTAVMRSVAVLLVLGLPGAALAQFDLPGGLRLPVEIPGIGKPIPGLDGLFKEEPPITTSLADARTDIAFLDDFDPQTLAPFIRVPLDGRRHSVVLPGLWEASYRSYCIKAGTYEPTEGSGYLHATLKGPKAGIISNILRNAAANPEIKQKQVQILLWGIIAKTKLSDMQPETQQLAGQLLTPAEVDELNGGGVGRIPMDILRKAIAKLPPDAQRVFRAEAEIRDLLTRRTAVPFEHLERVAVLRGTPAPPKGSRTVPAGRWCYHPSGFFLRYFPQGYWRTRVHLYSPEPLHIEADALGRITSITDPQWNRVQLQYDDGIAPLVFAGDPGVKGYAFSRIRFQGPDMADDPREFQVSDYDNVGWTLVGVPSGHGRAAPADPRFADANARYRWAVAHKGEVGAVYSELRTLSSATPADPETALADIADIGTLAEAVRLAVGGEESAWVKDHCGLVYRAWQAHLAALVAGRETGIAARTPDRERATHHARASMPWPVRLAAMAYTYSMASHYTPVGDAVPSWAHVDDTSVPGNAAHQRLAHDSVLSQAVKCNHNFSAFNKANSDLTWFGYIADFFGGAPSPTTPHNFLHGHIQEKTLNMYYYAGNELSKAEPPRDDYDLIANDEDLWLNIPLFDDAAGSPGLVHAANGYIIASNRLTSAMRAAVVSYDRCGGARNAGDLPATQRQIQAMMYYERVSAEAMLFAADRLEGFIEVMRAERIKDIVVPLADVSAAHERLQTRGFSERELAEFRELGATEVEIEGCLRVLVDGDPTRGWGSRYVQYRRWVHTARALGKELMTLPALPLPD